MKVLVLMGSIRKVRNTPVVAKIVHNVCVAMQPASEFEVIDLAEWELHPEREEQLPMTGKYSEESTKRWSAKVALADAFVVVSPQYNWGYPAALKNALDVVFNEYVGKPVGIVTFGGHGGDKCSAQLRTVMQGGLRMRPTTTSPQITVDKRFITEHVTDEAALAAANRAAIEQMVRELFELAETPGIA